MFLPGSFGCECDVFVVGSWGCDIFVHLELVLESELVLELGHMDADHPEPADIKYDIGAFSKFKLLDLAYFQPGARMPHSSRRWNPS